MIPLISSVCYGPLGVCQLPRTWWKVLLQKAGLLDSEYPDFSSGLDKRVLEVLKLNKEITLSYLREEMPNYLQFEAWILKEKGGELNQKLIKEWNGSLRTRRHIQPEKIKETYADIGFEIGQTLDSAVILNSLQDWQLFHKRDFCGNELSLAHPVIPLISSLDYGPIKLCQLPRTWYKILLQSKGLLHSDYPDMTETGLDPRVLKILGLEIDKTLGYIREYQPNYLDFENWVIKQCKGQIDRTAADKWNSFIRSRIHPVKKRLGIHATVDPKQDDGIISAVVLNHIEDWHFAHTGLMKLYT